MIRAKDSIRLEDGSITTMGEALDEGLLEVEECQNWNGKGKPAYFANFPGTQKGYQITESLYRSRTGQPVVTRTKKNRHIGTLDKFIIPVGR